MSDSQIIASMVTAALSEDVGSGDITSQLLDESKVGLAKVITRQDMVLCGCAWVDEVFSQISRNITIVWNFKDGDFVRGGSTIFTVQGLECKFLSGERVALNFLQSLSSTATKTRELVDIICNTSAKLLDTRKTIPLWRYAQKYAVRCGGGTNHRMGLYDEILIKENHIKSCGSIENAIDQSVVVNKNNLPIVVEVETLSDLKRALPKKVSRIMLDNFSISECVEAVGLTQNKVPLEVSGNITQDNILQYALTGINFISVGSITKNICAIDLSLILEDAKNV